MSLEQLQIASNQDLQLNNASTQYVATRRNFGSNSGTGYRGGINTSIRGRGQGAQGGGRGNYSNQKPICQVCGKAGHIAIKCYHRFDLSYQGPDTSGSSTRQPASPNQAYIATPTGVSDGA